jgi:hypothetical protein
MPSVLRKLLVALGCCGSVACAATSGGLPGANAADGTNAILARPAVRPARTKSYVYTCQNGTLFQCLVYDLHGKVVDTIADGIESPLGIATDVDGNVYVANNFADNVPEFGPGGSPPIATLDDSGNGPVDVAVSHGVVAVANQTNATVYVNGATEPTRTLAIPNLLQASGVAFDSKGNCYVAFVKDTLGTAIDEFAGCDGSANELEVNSGTPYNIAFDKSDNLYFTDMGPDTEGVYVCKGVLKCHVTYQQFGGVYDLTFDSKFKTLYVSTTGSSSGDEIAAIDIATGQIVHTYTKGLSPSNPPLGVAIGPGAPY